MTYEKHYIQVTPEHQICLHRFYSQPGGNPVYMLHGAIENGKIFYSKSGKGFGPFLADKGFDVFIADMRGKGESKPKVSKKLKHSQTELITVDIPKSLDKIKEITGKEEFHFVSHSWGGVILYAFLARFSKEYKVKSQVMFAGKRRISVISPKRILHADIIWNLYGSLSGNLLGYVPFKHSKIGSENEPLTMFKQMNKWVYTKQWIDQEDNFNYSTELKKTLLPPTLHLTGIKDDVLGNPIDVELLRKEAGEHQEGELFILGKNYGNKYDYDHINILTHPLAEEDHFITAYKWIKKYDNPETEL